MPHIKEEIGQSNLFVRPIWERLASRLEVHNFLIVILTQHDIVSQSYINRFQIN